MNRTTLIIAIGIIIAVCTGIYFWTEWEKARFDASLPEVPVPEQVRPAEVNDGHAGGHWHGDEWHAEPHVADEAPPVQTVTQPVETDEMEAARQRVALELPSIPPSELELEAEAIQADLDALIERRGSLSLAEFEKGIDDIVKRQNAWRGKWEEQAKERAAAYRKMDAERKPAAVAGDR